MTTPRSPGPTTTGVGVVTSVDRGNGWRSVKAEVLARRGEMAAAVELARAAVELADPTDALVDKADAVAALGTVLTLTGDGSEGRAATEWARSLYEQKGATALAARRRRSGARA